MPENVISENFSEFGGVDYRSNAITRKPRFSAEVENVLYLGNNALGVRPGTMGRAPSTGGGGTKKFTWLDSEGISYNELLTIDDNLHRRVLGSFSITYVGAADNILFSIIPVLTGNTYSFYAYLIEDDVEVFSLDLGTGVNELAPVTITTLVTAINALADYSCSLVGTSPGTGPAAFIGIVNQGLVDSVASTIEFAYWEQIYSPITDPFSAFFAAVSGENGELAGMLNHANRFLIATGFNELYKYDSVSVYRAGMPFTESLSAATTGTGITGTYEWFVTYEQVDALGHIVEGDQSNTASLVLANQTGRLTIPQIQPTTGFLTSCAIANNGGTETGTTLTVDDGSGGNHTLQVGQTVFFYDNGGAEVTDVITARTGTTITFANSYTIANNAIISANLRINIYRNKNGSTELFYLVDTIANNSFVASVTYDDATADASLGAEYEFPIEGHGLPPANMKYLTSYGGLLILANALADIWFSDPDGPEYVNNSFRIRSKSNAPITAIGANKDALYAFKSDESHVVTGDLPNSNYRAQYLSTDIGCASYHSIADVDNSLWFHSAKYGPRRIISTSLPEDVSFRVLPVLTRTPLSDSEHIKHSRVIAYNIKNLQVCVFFYPTETEVSSVFYPNTSSFCLAADYRSQYEEDVEYDEVGRVIMRVPKIRWWRWGGLNLGAGGDEIEDEFVYTEKRYSDVNSAMEYALCKFMDTNSEYDVHDHAQPMDWLNEASWMDLNSPEVLKKMNEIAIWSIAEFVSTSFSVLAETYIDYVEDVVHSSKTITFGGAGVSAGWGYGGWGDFAWGDPVVPKQTMKLKPSKTAAVKLVLSATLWLQKPVISGWTIQAAPVFKTKIQK